MIKAKTGKKTQQELDDAVVDRIIKEAVGKYTRENKKSYKPIKWTTNNYKASIINDFLKIKNAR
jgi:histone H3/H4